MARFYRLVRASEGLEIDTRRAAALEVEWWRAHREDQYAASAENAEALVRALTDLYSYTYGVEHSEVRRAAELRAEAMDVSDCWVAAGCAAGRRSPPHCGPVRDQHPLGLARPHLDGLSPA